MITYKFTWKSQNRCITNLVAYIFATIFTIKKNTHLSSLDYINIRNPSVTVFFEDSSFLIRKASFLFVVSEVIYKEHNADITDNSIIFYLDKRVIA